MAYRVERIEKILEREIATILFDSAHNDKLKFISITKVSFIFFPFISSKY